MIYLTGDMHGDRRCFKDRKIKKLKKKDTLIVLGDFGFIWDGSKSEVKFINWLARRRYQILFITGTHDNYSILHKYPQSEWNGGQVRIIKGKLIQLMRGQIYTIENKSVFSFGGGHSDDYLDRDENTTWWPEELPSNEEMEEGQIRLKQNDMTCDIIVSHDAPGTIRRFLLMDNNEITHLNDYFEKINKTCRFVHWYFGCYHMDKQVTPKHTALYRAVIPIK